jgi:hypothetical protein
VTGIDSGLFEAPVPALNPATETDTETVDGAVPDDADKVSHDMLDVAAQVSVPVPPLAIWRDCAEGAVPPVVYPNCRLAGVTARVDADTE